jgi:hypothetical protein
MKLNQIIAIARKRPEASWISSLNGPTIFSWHAAAAHGLPYVVNPPLIPAPGKPGWFTDSENEDHSAGFATLRQAVEFAKTLPVNRNFGDERDWPTITEITKSDDEMTLDLAIFSCVGGKPTPIACIDFSIERSRRAIWDAFYAAK